MRKIPAHKYTNAPNLRNILFSALQGSTYTVSIRFISLSHILVFCSSYFVRRLRLCASLNRQCVGQIQLWNQQQQISIMNIYVHCESTDLWFVFERKSLCLRFLRNANQLWTTATMTIQYCGRIVFNSIWQLLNLCCHPHSASICPNLWGSTAYIMHFNWCITLQLPSPPRQMRNHASSMHRTLCYLDMRSLCIMQIQTLVMESKHNKSCVCSIFICSTPIVQSMGLFHQDCKPLCICLFANGVLLENEKNADT